VEDPKVSIKNETKLSRMASVGSMHKDVTENCRNAPTGNINPEQSLTSTSSSQSSQSPSNCCQFVSVVVTNENQPSSNKENSESDKPDNRIPFPKDKTNCNPNSMEVSNENESPVELKHNSNDEDILSNAKNISGNPNNVGSDIQMVIIERNSENDLLNDENNSPLHTEKEVENDVKCDSAFTDDSCIQFIDAESID